MTASTAPKAADCTGSYAIAPDSAGDLGEADLDIEHGRGGNAAVTPSMAVSDACSDARNTGVTDPVTTNAYGAFDALQHARCRVMRFPASAPAPMGGKVLPVIGMSYGDCEASFSGDASYTEWVRISECRPICSFDHDGRLGRSGPAECDTQGEPTSMPRRIIRLTWESMSMCRRLTQLHRCGRYHAKRR